MFALVDCNNFYVSCERVFRPGLMGKPVVVLSNNDGCVIARSNEAKQIGIPMGAPAFKFEKMFEKHRVHMFSANFALYGDMSRRVMNILNDYTPDMEIYSIDEAFLKLSGFQHYDLAEYSRQMRDKVVRWTGIPISIGAAPTKALAKVANRIAKKYADRTGNVHVINTEERHLKALKWLEIEDVWGIGKQHARRLKNNNVHTAYDFTGLEDAWVKKHLSIVGLRLKQDLQGTPTLDLEEAQPKKNIATTRSFEQNYTEFEQLRERIATFATSCAEKLRKQDSCCNSLMVFIHTNGHRDDLPQYSKNIVVKLPFPTNSSIELTQFAVRALKHIFKKGYHYKKAGVVVQDFTPARKQQLSLLENSDRRHGSLMQSIDQLNARFGQQKIRLASQDTRRVWKMKQEKLSPKYTTRLSDVIVVKA